MFNWREMISHMRIWAYKMADPGLMLVVVNSHFKAFPDQFVILLLYQATGQDTNTDQVELKVAVLCPYPSLWGV